VLIATTASSGSVVLVTAVFLACAVEMVEALTIVLAVGVTRGWRSALEGAVVALVVLAALVAALGPALVHYVPLSVLRLVVGGLLLVFGLQWLRKAVLRAAGIKAQHDEDAIFAREAAAARAAGIRAEGLDGYAFTLAFKGVLLEGLEVVFIVLSFGADHHMLLAVAGAAVAVAATAVAGVALHRPLARVPENTTKFVVGLMLTTFGSFWGGEGVGVRWPGSDAAIPVLLLAYAAVAAVAVGLLRRAVPTEAVPA